MTFMERVWNIFKAVFYIIFWPYPAYIRHKESQVISEEPGGIYEDDWIDLFFAIAGVLLLAMTAFSAPLNLESRLLNLDVAVVYGLGYIIFGIAWVGVVWRQFLWGRFDRALTRDLERRPD